MDQASNTYTTAVALNNMGVSLLERKCFRQALETLHDAVQLMRKHHDGALHKFPKQNIFQAHQRQCRPEPCKPECPLHLKVVSDDTDSDSCLRASNSQHACLAIRLEGFESTNDTQIDTAVIIHNYAIAALSLALSHPTSKAAKQLLEICLKSLLQCQKELSARYVDLDMDGDFALVHKVFVVAVISTKSLLQALIYLGEDEYYSQILECQSKLETLQETLSELNNVETGAVAAAAA